MSSGKGPSAVIDRVRQTVRSALGGGYACAVCGLSYDDDRLNCPACGGPVERQ